MDTCVKYPYLEYPHRQSAFRVLLAGFDDHSYFLPFAIVMYLIIYLRQL